MEAGGFTANRGGQSKIQKSKPGLQHGEKAHEAIDFCAHVFDIQRQDQNAYDGDINLARVISHHIMRKGQFMSQHGIMRLVF